MTEYPSEYELDVVLRDGAVVAVRPLRATDAELMMDFFERLGPESRYFRYFRARPTIDRAEIDALVDIDYDVHMAIAAFDGNRMVGVAQYNRFLDELSAAEVAFAVADDQQGRGLGTELLQLLTSYARQSGVTKFRAFVLSENIQMMRVFRNSGFELQRTLEDGIYEVDFPVAYTADVRSAAEERERRAIAASILPLFYPRSVAVIGASSRSGAIGNTVFRNLLHHGFAGAVYPVNPHAAVVNSVRAYGTVLDIPDPVDLAIVVVPAAQVLGVAQECADKGVRGLVVISAGFGETGEEGRRIEEELLDIARRANMRLVGPNSLGIINTAPPVRMNGTFAPTSPPAGNIAMSSQSGPLGLAILEYARAHGFGMSQFVSVGNKADVSGNDLILAWENDPSTDVILLYLESFGNPRRFARLARRIARRKPIVAVKSGRGSAGSRALVSHSRALASADVAVDALFQQSGVIRVDTIEELFSVGSLLAHQPVPAGLRVGILSNAGAPSILAADSLESQGLHLPELSPAVQAAIVPLLPPEGTAHNPVNLGAAAGPGEYEAAMRAILGSGEVDALMVAYIPVLAGNLVEVARTVRTVAEAEAAGTTMVAVFMPSEEAAKVLGQGDGAVIPTYLFPETAALALARAARYGEWLRRDAGVTPELDGVDSIAAREVVQGALERLGPGGGWLEPGEVERVLAAIRVDLPSSLVVFDEDEAVKAAAELRGPVAVKMVTTNGVHKSDVDGVLLGVEGEQAVRAAFRHVRRAAGPDAGVHIQEMVEGGHEILIGMTEDPTFGPLLVFGLGGLTVELFGDVAFRLHPLTDVDADEMVNQIKGARLLAGYRNLPPGDVEGVKDLLLRVSALVGGVPEIVEMDVNPVKVLEHGVRPVDVRIRVEPFNRPWSPELVDFPGVV